MVPKNIAKEHIEKAILEIDSNGVRKGRHSSTYDLLFNGKRYPPKLVVSIANRFANGVELEPNDFEGGKDTSAFELLKMEGFEIIPKTDPVKLLVENYKKLISKTQLQDEIYKWKLVQDYKGRPDTTAIDFSREIKEVKFNNLLYAMGAAVINHIAKEKPEELRTLFTYLFDESKDLFLRTTYFNEETLKLYRSLGETLSHHQDERTIATYLTYHNPSKYTFYKSSFYKKYCKLIGVNEGEKNKKYVHYLELINQLIENYIKPDIELINQVKGLLPEYYDGTNHKLLAQDILYQMLDKESSVSYWVFQGNPLVFDFETALKQGLLTDWTVSAHKERIKIGDKVIIWVTGNESGCYALAEITSEPHLKTPSPDDHLWKGEDKSVLKAELKITHNLVDNPILKEEIQSIENLKDLKIGNQGTNFTATVEEYDALLELINSRESSFEKLITKLDIDDFRNYIVFLKEIVRKFHLTPGDDRLVFSIRDNSLNFIIGQRYCWNLFLTDPKGKFGVISKDPLIETSGKFEGAGPVSYYTHFNDIDSINSNIDSIESALEDELNRTKKSSFRKYNNSDFENYVFANNPLKANNNTMEMSLNTILYGPPGTGKTYLLKNKYMPLFTSSENSITRDEFLKDIIQNCSWWQIIALAVLELGKTKVASIFNHEFVKIKAQLSNSTTITPTIWGQLQGHTIEECEHVKVQRRMPPFIFNKTDNSEWEILVNEVKEQAPELLELKAKIDGFAHIPNKKIERFEFLTFHQSYSYEDFIEGIKPELSDSDISYKIEEGVFQKMCNRARNDSANKYAIFIDEINRGNISSIFGELITLIEDDKRDGKPNQIKATLPYSKKPFSVPNNLYIIGTMNTADRSVEALDTALRRRFSFIEMNPDPETLNKLEFKCDGIDLSKLLNAINARIEKLLDKDYCIGHSYFMTIKDKNKPLEELKDIFKNKILPLLQEYFYGDWGKIMLVVGKEFVYKKVEPIKFLSNDLDDDYEEYNDKPIYSFVQSTNWTLDSFKSIYE
ncbi:MAG: hypothetical protein CFE21_03655 [Bacteroidetes bacterium B1(2017)]|nr:MAG: hypothetical protein CFE21_03655 [Bacteroidetes bacterium B1(2017)]